MLNLFKLEHAGKTYIGIRASSEEEEGRLKTLPNYKRASSYNCGYLPYTTNDYAQLQQLNISFTISQSGTADCSESKSEITTIDRKAESSTISVSAHTKKVTIPQVKKGIIQIEWSGKYFTVALPYQHNDVLFLKTLRRSYWHSDHKCWIVGTSIRNLEALQKHFAFWDQSTFQNLFELIGLQEDPAIIELYKTPEFTNKVCCKIRGFRVDLSFVKQISGRVYDKEYRRWILPDHPALIANLVKFYEDKDCKVINRIATKGVDRNAATKAATGEKISFLVSKFAKKYQTTLDRYASVMLLQKYGWSTIRSYVGKFAKFMSNFEKHNLDDLSASDANKFLTEISKRNVSESLLNVYLSAIKFYYEKVAYRSDFNLERLKRPKKGRYLPVILSEQEVDRLLRSLKNLKHIALVYLIYSGGMRLGEVLSIRLKDIMWDRNQVLVKGGKGNKDRMTLLSQTLKQVLQNYFDEYQPKYWLFEGQDRTGPYSASSVQKIIRSAAQNAGIQRKVTPHTLRHCFATHLLDRGTDVRFIQELLGHKNIQTTLIYTHVTTRSLENIVSPLDRLVIPKENV
jgi:site-specific recombinase XerD